MNSSQYLVKSWKGRAVLRTLDTLLGWGAKRGRHYPSVKKLLLCNIAHLGDVVLSTAILPWIRAQHPHLHMGFLAGSWAKEFLEDHHHLNAFHCIDHWKLDRSEGSLLQKMMKYRRHKKELHQELLAQNYDLAIDLYPYFPNAIPLIYQAKIPCIAGYTSGGFGPMLTHPKVWQEGKGNMISYHVDLVMSSGLMTEAPGQLRPSLHASELSLDLPSNYIIFHLGAGQEKKEWSIQKWKELLEKFVFLGYTVVFTGNGARQKLMIEQVISGMDRTINLWGQLSLKELISVIQGANLLVTVDSVTGHIASAFDVPTLVLFSGINEELLWKPPGDNVRLLSHPLPCFPCLNRHGCASMACLQELSTQRVFETAMELYREGHVLI